MLFGLLDDTPIDTPEGLRPLSTLAVGDIVWAWHLVNQQRVARRVTHVHEGTADHLYELVTASARIGGCTPGVSVFDASEDMFRGAGSLSAIAEMSVWTPAGLVVEPLDDAREHPQPGARLRFLTHDGDEATFFAGGFLVRHQVVR